MSDQHLTESSNTIDGGRRSEMVVELNIKTLDSQIYIFQVDRSMLVSQFKEKIASEVGLPVGQQRLIFRGRVLKDDRALSEYHVENGHTLHLVARQSSESQPPSSGSSGEASSNSSSRGQDINATGLPHRIGQMSHSVVLGTLNLGDEGGGVVPDISRVIGAVLNSIGIGNQTATNVMGVSQPTVQFSSSVPVPQGIQMEGTQNNTGAQSQAGTQAQPGQALPSQSLPQVLQIPLGAAVQIPLGAAIPVPSLNVPIPDSLRTLSEYMNRMELALSQNGLQPNEPQSNDGDRPTLDLPSNVRGLPTPEALMIVLRHAQRLLSDRTVAALSHIAGRLEQEGGSTDPTVRGQIQTESMQLGLAMQHLGALLLELGRTILMLRMGQSPAESYINAGPAVYISSSGPNPIMVQPFPLQTNSLFGGSAIPANSGSLGPVGIGAVPRHVNIHIHTAVGPRGVSQADGQQGERGNRTSSGDSGQTRVRHSRNVIAAVVPSRPSVTVSSASQTGTSVSQTVTESGPISTHVAEVRTQLRNFLDNMRNENQAPSIGQSESSDIQNSSSRSGAGNDEANSQLGDMADSGDGELHSSVLGDELDTEEQKASLERIQTTYNEASIVNSKDAPPASSVRCGNNLTNGEAALKSVDDSECAPMPSLGKDNAERAAAVPLGLGLGGLQPKRKSRLPRLHDKASDSTTTNVSNQNQQTASNSQQALQSLASLMNMRNTSNITSSGHLPAAPGHMMGGGQMGGQGADGQLDVANAMSEVLHSPALSGLLTGVSQQTGVGSPDILRNMLEQFTRSPAMRNTVNQIAQQFDGQDVGNMLSGMGRGQGGGLDLAGMVQQMMPIVSQALGGGPTPLQPLSAVLPDLQPQYNERSSSRDVKASEQDSQIDLQPVVQRIEHQDPPEEVFRSVVTTAARSYDSGNDGVDLVNDLCCEEGLVTEFLELLRRDLRERLHNEKGPSDVL